MEAHLNGFYTILLIIGILIAILGSVKCIFKKSIGESKNEIFYKLKVLPNAIVIIIIGCILTIFGSFNLSSSNIVSRVTNPDKAKPSSKLNSEFIIPVSNSFTDVAINENENNKKVNKQEEDVSEYKNANTRFCAKMGDDGKGVDFGILFTRETETDCVYVYVDNKSQKFLSGKVKFNVFKLEFGEYRYYNSVSSKINPSWTYLYQPLQFNEPGEYEVDSYNESGVLISTGRFLLE